MDGAFIKVGLGKNANSSGFKQWLKCMYIAAAFIVVALLYYVIASILSSTVDPLIKLLSLLGMVFALGSVLWLLAFVFPKAFQAVFQLMGVKGSKAEENLPIQKEPIQNEPAKKAQTKEELNQTPINQPPQTEEESEPEKLRREYKNRKL